MQENKQNKASATAIKHPNSTFANCRQDKKRPPPAITATNDKYVSKLHSYAPIKHYLILSQTQPIACIPTTSLAAAYDLDDISLLQSKVPGHGIVLLDPGELALPEPVPLKQSLLLDLAEQDMFRYQLVLGDVDEQILLKEDLDGAILLDGGEALERSRSRRIDADHYSGVVVSILDTVDEQLGMLDADGRLREEFDPDGTAVRRRAGLEGRVHLHHALGRVGGEAEGFALRTTFGIAVPALEVGERETVLFLRDLVALNERPRQPALSSAEPRDGTGPGRRPSRGWSSRRARRATLHGQDQTLSSAWRCEMMFVEKRVRGGWLRSVGGVGTTQCW